VPPRRRYRPRTDPADRDAAACAARLAAEESAHRAALAAHLEQLALGAVDADGLARVAVVVRALGADAPPHGAPLLLHLADRVAGARPISDAAVAHHARALADLGAVSTAWGRRTATLAWAVAQLVAAGVPLPPVVRLGPAGRARWEALPEALRSALRAHPGWRPHLRPHLAHGLPLARCLDDVLRLHRGGRERAGVGWPDDVAGRVAALLQLERAPLARCDAGPSARVGLGLGGRR
jgi:hypothetical protein